MDTILILAGPSPACAGDKADKALLSILGKWEFCVGDFDGDYAEEAPKEFPVRLYSREGTPDLVDSVMRWAKRFKALAAVHLDGSDADNTYEWDHKAYITWWDPATAECHEYNAGSITPEPDMSFSVVEKMITSNANPATTVWAFVAQCEALRKLGIL